MYARSAYTGFLSRLANDLPESGRRSGLPVGSGAPVSRRAIDDCLCAYEALLDAGAGAG